MITINVFAQHNAGNNKLNLQKPGFTNTINKNEGRPPFVPAPLLKLYLYDCLDKIRSSRKLEKEYSRYIEFQGVIQNLQPN